MQIVGLDHYNICGTTEEIDEVRDFYGEIMGFTEGFRPGFGVEGCWLYAGTKPLVHLTVHKTRVEEGQTGNLHHIALRCQGLEEILQRLRARGVPYQRARVESMDITQIFFHDPAGIRIELSFVGEQ